MTGKEVCKSLNIIVFTLCCWVILMICEVLLNLMDSLDNLHLSPFADADYILIKDIIELFLIRKYCFYNIVRKWLSIVYNKNKWAFNKTNSKKHVFTLKKVLFFFIADERFLQIRFLFPLWKDVHIFTFEVIYELSYYNQLLKITLPLNFIANVKCWVC